MITPDLLDAKYDSFTSEEDAGRIRNFSEYVDHYWKERKRVQFAYDANKIETGDR